MYKYQYSTHSSQCVLCAKDSLLLVVCITFYHSHSLCLFLLALLPSENTCKLKYKDTCKSRRVMLRCCVSHCRWLFASLNFGLFEPSPLSLSLSLSVNFRLDSKSLIGTVRFSQSLTGTLSPYSLCALSPHTVSPFVFLSTFICLCLFACPHRCCLSCHSQSTAML